MVSGSVCSFSMVDSRRAGGAFMRCRMSLFLLCFLFLKIQIYPKVKFTAGMALLFVRSVLIRVRSRFFAIFRVKFVFIFLN